MKYWSTATLKVKYFDIKAEQYLCKPNVFNYSNKNYFFWNLVKFYYREFKSISDTL